MRSNNDTITKGDVVSIVAVKCGSDVDVPGAMSAVGHARAAVNVA
jgi:hypothetical protein